MPLQRQGIALIAALVFAFIIFILVAIGTVSSYSNRENAAAAVNATKAQLAAEAGLDQAVNRVWHQVWAQNPSAKKNLTNYRNLLIQRNIPANSTINANGTLGDASFTYSFQRADVNPDGMLGTTVPSEVTFKVVSTGSLGTGFNGAVRKLEQTLTISAEFPDNYSLLTRSINCTFCHASFQSMDALSGDATVSNPWNPTSVGVLDILQTRGTGNGDFDTDTTIHGTLYSRGNTANWQGGVVAGALAPSLTTSFDPTNSSRVTDSTAKRALVNEITDCSIPNACRKDQPKVFYKNYPTQKPTSGWPGAELPSEFPKPIPDTNGNNLVDQSEWDTFIASLTDSGTIKANHKIYNNGTLSWGGTANSTLSGSDINGNLLLDGTSSPIEIEGTVYVDGDVVLRGEIKGNGRIVAKGNVYVMGNVTYNCGSGPCSDADYAAANSGSSSNPVPQFNLVAGGNIVIGDHSHRARQPNLPPSDVAPTLSECADYPGRPTSRSEASCSPVNSQNGSGDADYDVEYTVRQIADFNRLELINYFERGGGYRPRFYTRNGEEDVAFLPAVAGEGNRWNDFAPLKVGSVVDLGRSVSGVSCDTSGGGCRITITAGMLSGNLGAAANQSQLLPIASSKPFEGKLRELWRSSVDDGFVNGNGEGLRFDGLMYSANAIFALMSRRLETRSNSNRGLIDIRGGIIAADTGILAPGPGGNQPGFKVYHDQRLRPQIASSTAELQLYRNIQQLVKR